MRSSVRYMIFLLVTSALIVHFNRPFFFWDEEEREIVDVLPKDPEQIPTLYQVSDAAADYLENSSLVVGVYIGGVAKAYPIMVLDRHEVINDKIGSMHFIVSYCPLTNSPLVYTRPRQTAYGVSGKLFKNNLVLYDNTTQTLWSQIYMRGIMGEMKNALLEHHPCYMLEWGAWKKMFPDSRLIALPSTYSAEKYVEDSYADYRNSQFPGVFPLKYQDFSRGQKEMVLIVTVGESAKAYPYSVIESEKVLMDQVGGQNIVATWHHGSAQAFYADDHVFHYGGDLDMVDELGDAWSLLTGAMTVGDQRLDPVRCIPVYWFACKDFYPEINVYQKTS